jgi:tRNA (mo5U34)-methyltransferase
VLSPEERRTGAATLPWFHSIDLGDGVITPGDAEPPIATELLPSFAGRRVLDIGAWDGYYSFLAERQGAAKVVALDHYVWGVDFDARGAYWHQCMVDGVLPDQSLDTTRFWRDDLPGRRSFEFAAAALDSKVEPVKADIATADLDALGRFDVVLCLGVLYHMKEPFTLLERVRSLTDGGGVAVIETEAIHFEQHDDEALLRFHAGGDLHIDFGNWFVPTIGALHAMCRAAGFSSVRTVIGPPPPPAPDVPSLRTRVGRRLAQLPPPPPPSAPSMRFRAVVEASA